MSFDWTEYFNLAKELSGQKGIVVSKEAKLRAAISRAYYAAYCKARNYLRDVIKDSQIPKGPNVHKYVVNKFKSDNRKNYRKIGINLDRLRIDRNKADYDDIVEGISSLYFTDLRYAQKILSTLSK